MIKTDLNIHIYPRAAKANAAGLFPIYVRITLNAKRSEFSIRKFIDPVKWDEKAMRVKGFSRFIRPLRHSLISFTHFREPAASVFDIDRLDKNLLFYISGKI